MTDEPSYELVMPFVSVTSKGGPHDDESYAAGWEMADLNARLEHAKPVFHEQPILTDSAQQADLIGMKHGYRVEITEQGEGWSWLNVTLPSSPEGRQNSE